MGRIPTAIQVASLTASPRQPMCSVSRSSATLSLTVLQDVKEAAGFDNDIFVERTSMDRPEIYIEADVLKHDQVSMLDLLLLLPVS